MKTKKFDVNKLRVASPCSVGWDSMTGDERSRLCNQCSRTVYNISGLSAPEVKNLVSDRADRVCIRLFRRSDGTVLTNNCPVGLRLARKRLGRFVVAAFGSLIGLVTVGYGQRSEKPKREPPKAEKIEEAGKGTLNGVVRDSVGAVIPGVRLELFQEGVKKPRKTKSDADGNFEFAKVPAGIFVIKAHLQSFKKTRVENIILKDQQTTTVNVVMEPGEISVTVGMADYLE